MDKKQIAIITPGILPIPCTKGGAVENLIELYIQENEIINKFQFHIYSIYDKKAKELAAKYKHTSFHFFKPRNLSTRIKRYIYTNRHYNFYYNPYMDYYGYWAIKQLEKRKTDLLIIENRQGFILKNVFKKKYPIILHLHNDSLSKESPFAKEILNNYDKIITVSNYIKKQVDSIAPNSKTEVVYNGIDTGKFLSPKPIYRREDFRLSKNDFIVLYTGRISPIKGIRELLQAFIQLKEYPQIKLLIVGSSNFGENTEDDFFKEMKVLSEQIKEQVIFTGYISHENIPSLLSNADIGIIPSICEDALTLSSLEDMAAGLPLIVTRSGGIPEAVNENCAIIVEKDKNLSSSLAQSILYMYHNKAQRDSMSQAAIKRSRVFDKINYTSSMLSLMTSMFEK